MLRLFKRKNKADTPVHQVWQKINAAIAVRQRKWADLLQRKTRGYSRRTLTLLLILFCLVFGGSSVYTIWQTLHSKDTKLPIYPITVPQHIGNTLDDSLRKKDNWTGSPEYARIQRFKNYMDTLSKSRTGKATYDSILKARPGLMDSIRMIEKIFQ